MVDLLSLLRRLARVGKRASASVMGDARFDALTRAPTIKAIDLFCGAGGLAYGLKTAGITVVAGVDLDPACKFPFETNCGGQFAEKSVTELTPEELSRWFDGADIRVLAGCAPCQPFSTYSQSRKSKDDRWKLLDEFKRLALAVRPEIVTMENVRGLAAQKVWKTFVRALRKAGYEVDWAEIDCVDHGIPQSRRRLVLLASLLGPIKLQTQAACPASTVKDAIGNLPPIVAGEGHHDDPLHVASTLSRTNLKRIQASKPGGTWRDWPKELRATCHTKETGKTYPAVYGRMEWGKPAPTITTQCYGYGNGRFGHPEQDRAISLREAAILQSFPREYKFLPPGAKVWFSTLGTLIGNAVPPKLGESIGRSIIDHVERIRAGRPPVDGMLPFASVEKECQGRVPSMA